MVQAADKVYRNAKVYSVALDGTETHAEALAIKDDPVIRGMGWDRTWFSGGLQGIIRPFTRHDIDVVVPDKPVVLMSFCGHRMMLNTKALEVAGVTKDTDSQNGLIVKEADGSPSGYLKEPAVYGPIIAKIPNYEFSNEEHHSYIRKAFEEFAENGYTLLCDCQQIESPYEVVSEMAKNGELTVRVSGVHNINDETREEDLEKAVKNRTKFDVGDLFIVDTVKYFADGTLSMIEPYVETAGDDKAGTREPLLWDEEHMEQSMVLASREGFNIHTHAMGSYATRRVIDCYENAQKLYPNPKARNIIAHCTFVTPKDRVRMGENHIIASIQPGWFSDSPASQPVMVSYWGVDVIRQTYPSKSY